MVSRKVPCATKTELLLSYNKVVKTYSDFVSTLCTSTLPMASEEREQLWAMTREWRARAEDQRATLERHVKEHGC